MRSSSTVGGQLIAEMEHSPVVAAGSECDSTRAVVVAEQPEVQSILSRLLADRGYHVAVMASGAAALECLGDEHPNLMLLDSGLRDADGVDVLTRALEAQPDLAVVLLLREGDPTSTAECLRRGAIDCLLAPAEGAALTREMERPLRWWDRLLRERRQLRQATADASRRNEDLQQAVLRQEHFTVATLDALVNAREARNPYLAGHSQRVAGLAANIASQLGLAVPQVGQVRQAGHLHDLGMIGVRDNVLNKPTSLSDKEYQHVKRHSAIGAWILSPLTHLGPVVEFVHSHHERWDGRGYPDGLAGGEIPLGGRILHAAEVFDALTTDRPYQKPRSVDGAVRRMRELANHALDAAVVEALIDAGCTDHTKSVARDPLLSGDWRGTEARHIF